MDSAVALLSSLFLSLPGLYLRTLKANHSILIFLDLSPCIFMTFKLRLVFRPLYLPSWACEPPINMTMLKNICARYRTTQVIISFGYGSVWFDTYYSFNPIFFPSRLKCGCCGLLPLSFGVMLVPPHAHERGAALSGRNVWSFGLFQLNFPFQSTTCCVLFCLSKSPPGYHFADRFPSWRSRDIITGNGWGPKQRTGELWDHPATSHPNWKYSDAVCLFFYYFFYSRWDDIWEKKKKNT